MFISARDVSRLFPQKPLSTLLGDIKNEQVKKIEVIDSKLLATYMDGKIYSSYKEGQDSFYKILADAGVDPKTVEIDVKDTTGGAIWFNLISNILPIVLMVGFFLFLIRQARGAQDTLFSFGQSRARLFTKDIPKVTFADVAGVDEAKQELSEVVDFLKNPLKYRSLGARTPKGVLLVGPSGTGKTLLARALAGEARVPFFSMAGSEFMEMLVGVGASRVRDLFATAKKSSPAIIFIDEIDAIGRIRSVGVMGAHDEREQPLNQILVEMDGFTPNENVIVVAATNRGDLLDPALLRPGRFDRRVALDLPDMSGRKAILAIHIRGKPVSSNVDWDKVAKRTVGFSGADLENMLNEAAILAARRNKKVIEFEDIEEAATKVKLGPEKKRLQSDLDRKMTAYHEAGHAIVTHELPHMDPVHRISIVSRGMTLGFTLIPPQKDRIHETRTHLLEQITSMLGGRAAEEMIFAEMTTGAANDIDKATSVAREMVEEFGMSELGPINFGPTIDMTEWGGRY
ncbi:ATP-dependent zinc metalloprotease FtsH, partial [Candidatus Gottesmanbacteria bacterium]|nr:ATP-dependent zinc metalloprotease FtsH [Candidatus Gottesmanbacteria bacterium]